MALFCFSSDLLEHSHIHDIHTNTCTHIDNKKMKINKLQIISSQTKESGSNRHLLLGDLVYNIAPL